MLVGAVDAESVSGLLGVRSCVVCVRDSVTVGLTSVRLLLTTVRDRVCDEVLVGGGVTVMEAVGVTGNVKSAQRAS